jgi:hypothetical protein
MTTKSPADNIPLANEFPHAPPPEPGSHPINRFFDRFLVVVFCLVIVVPLIGTGRKWDQSYAALEKRKLTPFPESPHTYRETTKWPEKYFAYFKDNFGLRSILIHYFQDFRYRNGLLAHNGKVLLGKDGWLFFSQRGAEDGFEHERGFFHLSEEQLDLWETFLEKRTEFLKKKGIPYLVVIAPEKQSVYPEYMPKDMEAWVDGPGTYARGPIDEFLDHLKKNHSQVDVLDLRPALRAYKKAHPGDLLYFKGDTHWDDLGAYVGYLQIMKETQRLLPQFKFEPQPRSNFVDVHAKRVCDLVPMLGLQNQMEEPITVFWRKVHYPTRDDETCLWGGVDPKSKGDPFAHPPAPEDVGKPRLLMPRDSFSNSLFQLVGPHFDRPCFWFQDGLDLDMLEHVKPHIVIHEIVERKLWVTEPVDPPQIADPELWAQMEAAMTQAASQQAEKK